MSEVTETPVLRSVLLIDDEPDDIELATYVLRRSNVVKHVLVARDGTEALALYEDYEQRSQLEPESFPPIVVLIDINMPLMGGFEFLERLEELDVARKLNHVVVMLTSSDADVDRERAERFPMIRDFLIKPLKYEHLERIAEHARALGN